MLQLIIEPGLMEAFAHGSACCLLHSIMRAYNSRKGYHPEPQGLRTANCMDGKLSASLPCRLPGSDTPEYLENIPGYVSEFNFASCENVQVQAPA